MEIKMFDKMIAFNFANLDYEISNDGILLMGRSCNCDCNCDNCDNGKDCDCDTCDCKNT